MALKDTAIDEIIENFALLDDWDDRYRYLIELGRTLAPLPEAARNADRVLVLAPSVGGDKAVTDYVQLFDYNVATMVAALKQTTGK